MEAKEIDITVTSDLLTIKGEKKEEKEEKGENFHRRERRYGSFSRSFRLPVEVKADTINADYKDGVLTVTLPKVEKEKPRRVEITS
jgi:HSP20 family protein